VIRVFPVRNKWTPTDDKAFIGFPDLFMPPEQPVRISVTFTWDIPLAERIYSAWKIYYSVVQIGGPAFGDPGGEFEPGLFMKEGVTITSRGCVRKCPWCFVPDREGKIRELEIKPGWIVQDNNLLACSKKHIEAVFEMLREQKRAITFSGGLDTRLLTDWHRKLFDTIKIHELWFACDSEKQIDQLRTTARIMDGIKPYKRRCYTMIGFDGETIGQAEKRLETVYELGFFPFCQLYQGANRKEYEKPWRDLQRKWARPAAYNKAL
jgi:hypothetical protein